MNESIIENQCWVSSTQRRTEIQLFGGQNSVADVLGDFFNYYGL